MPGDRGTHSSFKSFAAKSRKKGRGRTQVTEVGVWRGGTWGEEALECVWMISQILAPARPPTPNFSFPPVTPKGFRPQKPDLGQV